MIDTQVAMYGYSIDGSADRPLQDAGEWYYACGYTRAFQSAISAGYSTGQAAAE